ncbi:MAG: hypothetical protein LBS36_09850 [Oscillospiraceae bacterium]|jgi:hypothetical protein|nr:hypothetical protein [Oscillospiraceae bacterium]
MKKTFYILLLLLFLFSLVACTAYEGAELIYNRGDQPNQLIWNNINYTEYQTVYKQFGDKLPDAIKLGKQIGIVDGDKKTKLCEIKGYSPDEWLITHFTDSMSNEYRIFKADHVTDIPPELEISNFQ